MAANVIKKAWSTRSGQFSVILFQIQHILVKTLSCIPKGTFFKDERSLGGRGGRPNAVTISDTDVISISNNDVILRSEGGRGSQQA